MISKNVKYFCKDPIYLIENYEEAINSDEIYCCHHRLETDLGLSAEELKEKNMYFDRPASELIFLTNAEHCRLHNSIRKFSEETRNKMSLSKKGKLPEDYMTSEEIILKRNRQSEGAKKMWERRKQNKQIYENVNSKISDSMKRYWAERKQNKNI